MKVLIETITGLLILLGFMLALGCIYPLLTVICTKISQPHKKVKDILKQL